MPQTPNRWISQMARNDRHDKGQQMMGGHMAGPELEALNVGRLMGSFWRRKWLIALAFILGALLAYLATGRMTPTYESRIQIALETRKAAQDIAATAADETEISASTLLTEMQVLRSPLIARRVVDALNLQDVAEFAGQPAALGTLPRAVNALAARVGMDAPFAPPPVVADKPEDVVKRLRNQIDVFREGTSYVVSINATSQDADLAAAISNEVARQYREWRFEQRQDNLGRMAGWLDARIDDVRARVEEAENRAAETRSQNLAAAGVSADAVRAQLDSWTAEAANLRARLAEHQARLDQFTRIKAEGSGDPAAIAVDNATIGLLKQRVADIASTEADLLVQYGPNSDRLRALQARHDAVRAELERAIEIQLTSSRDITARLVDSAAEQVHVLEKQLQSLAEGALQLRQVEREVGALQQVYGNLLTLRSESDAQEPMPNAEVSVIAAAVPSGQPAAPRVKLITAIGGILGALAGIVWIGFGHALNPPDRMRDLIEGDLRLPLLAEVPRGKWRKGRLSDWMRSRDGVGFVESMRQLRTSLLFADRDEPRVVMITSAHENDGKTTIAVALANLYASIGKRVLLIDGDLRRPGLASLTRHRQRADMVSLLLGQSALADAVVRDAALDFDMLTNFGSNPVANVDMLSTPVFADLVSALRADYDQIIIDTPPTGYASDALVIGRHVDATVFVVRADCTRDGAVRRGVGQLLDMGTPLAGAVLNMQKPQAVGVSYYSSVSYPAVPSLPSAQRGGTARPAASQPHPDDRAARDRGAL